MSEMATSGNRFMDKEALRGEILLNKENAKNLKKELLADHAKFGYADK